MEFDLFKLITEGEISASLTLNKTTYKEFSSDYTDKIDYIQKWENSSYIGNEFTCYILKELMELWFRDDRLFHIRIKFPNWNNKEYMNYCDHFKNSDFAKLKLNDMLNYFSGLNINYSLKEDDYEVKIHLEPYNIEIYYHLPSNKIWLIDISITQMN